MTDIKVNFYGSAGSAVLAPEPEFNNLHIDNLGLVGTTGIASSDLHDTSGASTGISMSITQAFNNDVGTGLAAGSGPFFGYDTDAWRVAWITPNGATSELTYSGFTSGEPVTVVVAGFSGKTSRYTDITVNGVTQTYTVSNSAIPDAPLTFNTTADAGGNVVIQIVKAATGGQYYGYLNFIHLTYGAGGATPSITDIDTDNAVDQYQQAARITLSGFTESITSVTLGGVACPIVGESVGAWVDVDIPALSASGTYDLVVSGATESATLTGVAYTLTHPVAIPNVPAVDSTSVLQPINYPDFTYLRVVTDFAVATFKTGYTDWSAVPLENAITDYIEFPSGTADGATDSATFEAIDPDGNTVQWTITVTAGAAAPISTPYTNIVEAAREKRKTAGGKSFAETMKNWMESEGATGRTFNELMFNWLNIKYPGIKTITEGLYKLKKDGYK